MNTFYFKSFGFILSFLFVSLLLVILLLLQCNFSSYTFMVSLFESIASNLISSNLILLFVSYGLLLFERIKISKEIDLNIAKLKQFKEGKGYFFQVVSLNEMLLREKVSKSYYDDLNLIDLQKLFSFKNEVEVKEDNKDVISRINNDIILIIDKLQVEIDLFNGTTLFPLNKYFVFSVCQSFEYFSLKNELKENLDRVCDYVIGENEEKITSEKEIDDLITRLLKLFKKVTEELNKT